jgi:hypothetical protein
MSVGLKGFRVGTGPRGNYVHMGRGGFYYRTSLGGAHQASRPRNRINNSDLPTPLPIAADSLSAIETGNVLEMKPTNGSDILEQINQKIARTRFWPWALGVGLLLSALILSQPNGGPFAAALTALTVALSLILSRIDKQRKTVVIMYDLDDQVVVPFKMFAQEFDKLATASRIWNIDTAGRTGDWKRNAGASFLVTRKLVKLSYGVPSVIKTNVDLPCIIGGRQNIYFFPDVVLVIEGNRAGAVSYDQLVILWNNTVFIEDDGVPSDTQVVGQTWRYVNKKGDPDRRFKNNRQVPRVLYQQMGVLGPGGLQKILHISHVADRSGFDSALNGLRGLIKNLEQLALEPPRQAWALTNNIEPTPASVPKPRRTHPRLLTACGLGIVALIIWAAFRPPESKVEPEPVTMATPNATPTASVAPRAQLVAMPGHHRHHPHPR